MVVRPYEFARSRRCRASVLDMAGVESVRRDRDIRRSTYLGNAGINTVGRRGDRPVSRTTIARNVFEETGAHAKRIIINYRNIRTPVAFICIGN